MWGNLLTNNKLSLAALFGVLAVVSVLALLSILVGCLLVFFVPLLLLVALVHFAVHVALLFSVSEEAAR
jgi:hypothetical protein